MNKYFRVFRDAVITAGVLCISFLVCLLIKYMFNDDTLISSVFVLGVFIISAVTEGYVYGIIGSFLSVLAVNFAFTFPFFAVDFTISENIISAVIFIVITISTCGFTVKLKKSEIIKAESEKEKMRANLLRAVSHDLRTPLTAIYSAGSALSQNRKKLSDEQQEKMLAAICEDAQWLSRMVENLLSITKLDGGKVKIIKTPTVLEELIDSVLVKFKKRYPMQKVDIDIPDEFVMIPMDAILIEQVILNILENAVQHAEGMTELSLKVFTISDKVVFEIKDNGCGIAEEKLSTIFTGCYNPKNSSTDSNRNNAGIGLSVCATIIKAHGGDIKAENLKTKGTVFRFVLDKEEDTDEQ